MFCVFNTEKGKKRLIKFNLKNIREEDKNLWNAEGKDFSLQFMSVR